ncbi:4-alpha-glucanotransferase [Pigmentiphaga humi]|uniref:4-alpha-glucanotransferase n=1 Tax=Pigmentiphaga humi TaxID=2478468 RepID=A0A3P4B496_9BURK|nr:4-alpha-glucanotransferase [Pigmentiphaga humi]VCU70761.1 4-alpha-glucanotransferase [Pigmentiphaga humi]
MSLSDHDLAKLAESAGICVHWRDAMGREQVVGPDVLRTILAELCIDADVPGCMEGMLREQGAAAPLYTAQQGEPATVPCAGDAVQVACRVLYEDGGHLDGIARRCSPGQVVLPAVDRPGYHTLLLGDAACTLAVAPTRCFSVGDALHREHARAWGLGVQLYSLRRDPLHAVEAGSAGFGDFTALRHLAESAAARGAAAVAVSPVHAMFSADPRRYSPYAPSSRLFLNVLHVDPSDVFGAQALAAVAAGGLAAELAELESLDLIDWPRAGRAKLAVLRALYDGFPGNAGAAEVQDHDAFVRAGGAALQAHARYEAVHAWRVALTGEQSGWQHWPVSLRTPDGPEVERFAQQHAREVGFHIFLQWLAARGLAGAQSAARAAGMPIGLIADLAVGTDPAGSHAWTRQQEVLASLSPGAPPDIYNPKGQAWGLTAFSPHALRAQGYRAFIEMLRASLAHAGGVRIDHALGLARMWLVPHGAAPSEGAYVRYPFTDMMRLIALESWRYRTIVIGENLGTVPEGFNDRIAQAGMLGIDVLWFTREGNWPGAPFRAPRDWSAQALATTTTHDLPTVAGWWEGRDIAWRERLGLLAEGSSRAAEQAERALDRARLWHDLGQAGVAPADEPEPEQAPVASVLGFLARTPAPLLLVPLEDMQGQQEQPNLPGTVDTHPNWRRRMPGSVGACFDDAHVAERADVLAHTRGIHER